MSYPHHPHSGPAGAPPNMAASFNAMLQRSMHDQQPPEPIAEVSGSQPPASGYGGVYNQGPPPQQQAPKTLGGARAPGSQPIFPGELPPQAFLTSSMLLDMVDKKVNILLRDEKEFIGILRSYDQFANLVLTECYERVTARNPDASPETSEAKWLACDVRYPGLLTIRGENVTICATVDLDREDNPRTLKFADEKEVRDLALAQRAKKKVVETRQAKALKKAGIEPGFGMQA